MSNRKVNVQWNTWNLHGSWICKFQLKEGFGVHETDALTYTGPMMAHHFMEAIKTSMNNIEKLWGPVEAFTEIRDTILWHEEGAEF